jgi:hypothetical protein
MHAERVTGIPVTVDKLFSQQSPGIAIFDRNAFLAARLTHDVFIKVRDELTKDSETREPRFPQRGANVVGSPITMDFPCPLPEVSNVSASIVSARRLAAGLPLCLWNRRPGPFRRYFATAFSVIPTSFRRSVALIHKPATMPVPCGCGAFQRLVSNTRFEQPGVAARNALRIAILQLP